MRLSTFVGQELAHVPLVEVSARSWPFDLVAPLAAWFWIDTGFRGPANGAFKRLKTLEFDATMSCSGLDDLPLKADERLLSDAYHRALLELLARVHPRWQLECNDLGQLCCSGPDGRRVEGQQHGMLAVFSDCQLLAAHLGIDPVMLAPLSRSAGVRQDVPKQTLARGRWRALIQR